MNITMIRIDGRSMELLLCHKDIITIYHGGKIRSGDIIVYEYKGQHIIHRAMYIGIWNIIEMGDNNNEIHIIRKKKIIGKAITNISRGISLDNRNINKKIVVINWLRFLLGRIIKTPRDIIKYKKIGKLFLSIIQIRNNIQSQYKAYTN